MSQTNRDGSGPAASGPLAYWSPIVARVLMGLMLAVFGLNKFWSFVPLPPFTEAAAAFFQALYATGYMLPLVACTEITAGVLLLAGRFVPLALVLIAPVIVNIVLFHACLDLAHIPPALLLLALELYLSWHYRRAYALLFVP